MSGKITEELARRLAEADAEPDVQIPVIVTLSAGADPTTLEQQGFSVQRVFENIPAVAGTLTVAGARALADVDQIETIEFDGEAHAL